MERTYHIEKSNGNHYDTNDYRWYDTQWEFSDDTKEYLQKLIRNYPLKFEGCTIEPNLNDDDYSCCGDILDEDIRICPTCCEHC